jgi:hypothetical protein
MLDPWLSARSQWSQQTAISTKSYADVNPMANDATADGASKMRGFPNGLDFAT